MGLFSSNAFEPAVGKSPFYLHYLDNSPIDETAKF